MDWFLLAAAGAALFLARDIALLASGVPAVMKGVWAGVQFALFVVLGIAAESLSRDQAYAILRDPRFWIPAAVIHFGLWAAMFFGRRRPEFARNSWRFALIPAPVQVFCAGAFVWIALTRASFLEGWSAGAAAGAVWIAAVLGAATVWRGASAGSVLQFAAASNLSAILLIPIQQQSGEGSAVAEQPIDWMAALLPLALTGSLVLLSFLFHRHRSARRSA